jgi:hypothetical protein
VYPGTQRSRIIKIAIFSAPGSFWNKLSKHIFYLRQAVMSSSIPRRHVEREKLANSNWWRCCIFKNDRSANGGEINAKFLAGISARRVIGNHPLKSHLDTPFLRR